MNFRLITSNPIQVVGDDATAASTKAFYDFGRKNAEAYAAYLESIRHLIPTAVYDFAAADWHYNPNDHRCPHDAWVQEIRIYEIADGERHEMRHLQIELILLGAYHDRLIKLTYSGVNSHSLTGVGPAHEDWITDEIRLSDNKLIIHEIEFRSGATVLIECKDLMYEEKLTDKPYIARW